MSAVLILLAYLLGSIPTSYLVGRALGVDLRARGSGNLGATNAYRVLGAPAGAVVGLVDVLKGFIPVWTFPLWDASASPWLPPLYAAAAVAGHVWSVFLRFQGGKGVATGGGALLALAPLATAVAFLVWLGLVLVTRIVSVASLTAATLVPVLAAAADAPSPVVAFCAAAATFVWWTHRDNVRRLWHGEEHRFGRAPSPPPGPPEER